MNRVITHTIGQAPKRPSFLSRLLLRVRAAISGHEVFCVPNQSMLSTMNIRDEVIVDRAAYKNQPVCRGDAIVYKSQKHNNLLLPSRVVALAGDTIEIREGSLFVNEKLVPEPYVDTDAADQEYSKQFARAVVPAGHVFILGDFRDMSEDSRVIGPVATSHIHARILQGKSNVAHRPEG